MKTQLERELSDVLRKQAQSTHRVPFTMEEIRGTSARLRRRRMAATGVGVALAAVVALLGPVMLLGGDRDAAPVPTPPPTSTPTPGLEAVSGPGVRIELSDAPRGRMDAARKQGLDLNRLVVHQQDVQAVVNAMRAARAEAITVNGRRIASTTAMVGQGDVIVIDGVPHPQPYVIEVVGEPDRLVRSIEGSKYLEEYMKDVEQLGLGWVLDVETQVDAPAYEPSE